ncbi:MAG: hypothetical protein ISS70_26180 [Phycisphaerae bacterium]|nr:hypothetical protein [Phycisphaerae bacterium]
MRQLINGYTQYITHTTQDIRHSTGMRHSRKRDVLMVGTRINKLLIQTANAIIRGI